MFWRYLGLPWKSVEVNPKSGLNDGDQTCKVPLSWSVIGKRRCLWRSIRVQVNVTKTILCALIHITDVLFQHSIGYSMVSALSNICRSESGASHMIPTLP